MICIKMFVLRVLQILLILQPFVTSTYSLQNSTTFVNDTNTQINSTNATNTHVIVVKIDNATVTTTNKPELVVPVEGGDVYSESSMMQSTTDVPFTTTDSHVLHGREGEIEEVNQTVNNSQNITSSTITTTTNIHEENITVTEQSVSVNETKNTLADVPESETHNKTVPKKGVNFDEIVSKPTATTPASSETPTTTKMRPKKPTVTIGSDDEVLDAKAKSSNSTPTVPTIEFYEKSKEHGHKSTFVIPIVAVILSVPLVAIIINIVYKRGKEWWSHRHYRRMDFLIDGMYNN